MATYQAAIIGAGAIGATLDTPDSPHCLTHAHAYANSDHFDLVGFIDPDVTQGKLAAKRWGVAYFPSLEAALNQTSIDVVSVASPTDVHEQVLEQLTNIPTLKGGIIEKPVTESAASTKQFVDHPFYQTRPFALNYFRRFVPEFQTVRERIQTGEFGEFVTGSLWYGKGLLHNASHLLDIVLWFGIDIVDAKRLRVVTDYPADLSVDGRLYTKDGAYLSLQVVGAHLYKILEMELLFEQARVRITDDSFTITIDTVGDDQVYGAPYKRLYQTEEITASTGQAMQFVIADLYRTLSEGTTPRCSLIDGYQVQKLCESMVTDV